MPLLVESVRQTLPEALAAALARVYRDSPEFASSEAAMTVLAQGLGEDGSVLYSGVFNSKPIAAVLASGSGKCRQLRHLCVHPANRGRGVGARLMDEVRRLEGEQGVEYLEAVFDLSQAGVPEMLLAMGFIPHGEPPVYRCRLL